MGEAEGWEVTERTEKIVLDLLRKDLADAGSKFAAGLEECKYQWHEASPFRTEPNRKRFEALENEWIESVETAISLCFEKLIALEERRNPNDFSKLILEITDKECQINEIFKSGNFLLLDEFLPAFLEYQDTAAYHDRIKGQVVAIVEYLEQIHVVHAAIGRQEQQRGTTGQRIKTLRNECGWSQEDCANETTLDKKQVQRHESDTNKPTPKTLKRYADAFSKKLGRLVSVAELKG